MNNEPKILKQIQGNSDFRKALTRESFYWFFATYFPHYITYPTADFQKEMFNLLQDQSLLKVVITAFRGSAKSTIATLAFPIWAMVGIPQKKYILLISQTQELAKQILTNIKQEFQGNELLVKDFGPFTEFADEWRANSLVHPYYQSRISAISQSEGIRGLRHRHYRPDRIVIDDVEDLESVKTKENRDKLWNWLTGEIVPMGDIKTKTVFVGNLLHEDSLMMRLKDNILGGKMNGVYREYPLINDKGNIIWPGKYPSQKDIEAKRKEIADEPAWFREYILKIISDEERIVQSGWIHKYKELPDIRSNPPRLIVVGVDLAISKKDTADFTAIVIFYVTGYGDDLRMYILPHIINKRLDFTSTISEIKKLCSILRNDFQREPTVCVENATYDQAVVQQLTVEKVIAEPVSVARLDKKTRLSIASPYIRLEKVLFPETGAEDLISQIVNFGIEKHEDLVDAFTAGILKVIETDRSTPQFSLVEANKTDYENRPITAGVRDMEF